MKLLYCCHADNYHIEKWIPALEKAGIEVHILTLRPSRKLKTTQTCVNPIFQNISWFDFLSISAEIRETFFSVKADVLLCSFGSTYGLAGYLSGIKPFFIQTWSRDIGAQKSVTKREYWMSEFITRKICSKANGVTTDGPHFKQFLEKNWPEINPDKVCSTWWGIETDFWQIQTLSKINLKEKWGIPEKSPVLISPRGLFWYYRPLEVLQALFDVAKQNKQLHILLPSLNHSRTAQVEQVLEQLKNETQFHFVDSFLEPEQFREWIQMSDFLLSVPLFDGISEVVQEGMLCGAIPILNPIEANQILLDEGGKGCLTTSKQPTKDELVATISQVLSLPSQELDFMRTKNKAFILEKCSVEITAQKLFTFLKNQS